MAKRPARQTTTIRAWDEVNETLRRLARINATVDKATAEYNLQKLELDKALERRTIELLEEKEVHERNIELFCKDHQDDLDQARTKSFFYGLVKFRWGPPKLVCRSRWTWPKVIEELKRARMSVYLRVKEEPDKEALKDLDVGQLRRVGLDISQKEEFYYEAFAKDLDKLD